MLTNEQVDQLKKLKELYDAQILTSEEFETKKKAILDAGIASESAENVVSQVSSSETPNDTAPDFINTDDNDRVEPENQADNNAQSNQSEPFQEQQPQSFPQYGGIPQENNTEVPQGDSIEQNKSTPFGSKMHGRKSQDGKHKSKKPFYKRVWFWAVIIIILLLFGVGGSGGSDDSSSSSSEPTKKLVSIEADYDGATDSGTVLDEDNKGIKVTATYDDDSTKKVKGWTVTESKKLHPGKKSTVEIEYKGKTCKLTVKCTSMTAAQYKSKCKSISYDSIARQPDKYTGKYMKIYGQVVQVMEGDDGESVDLRIATKNDGYGNYYDDVVYVTYSYKSSDKKILEDDMVTVWGISAGSITYESTMSGDITIPAMVAEYIHIN